MDKLDRWYADPQRAVDYYSRPPVRTGKHGESIPAFPAGRIPRELLDDWYGRWRRATTQQKRDIIGEVLFCLDPSSPTTQQYKGFYGETYARVENGGKFNRPLISPRTPSGPRDGVHNHTS